MLVQTRTKGPSRIASALRGAILLVLVAFALSVTVNALRPQGLPWLEPWQPQDKAAQAGVATLTLPEAQKLFLSGGALFLDARDPDAYLAGHIPGAMHLVPDEAGDLADLVAEQAAGGLQIVTYCDGIDCATGIELARRLGELGITPVAAMPVGIAGWLAAGQGLEVLP